MRRTGTVAVSLTRRHPAAPRGFTRTELAVVLLIVALVIGGTLMTLSAQNEARQLGDTQRTLEQARDAIIGFAIRNERLPCPASGATGVETFVSATDLSCFVPATPANRFVPALTLGIGPTDAQGFLIDAWGNRIRYYVSQWSQNAPAPANCPPIPPNAGPLDFTRCPAFTTAGAMKNLGLTTLPNAFPQLLRICDTAGCTGQQFATPAVILSPGKNFGAEAFAGAAGGVDEEANVHLGTAFDGTFVIHEARPAGGAGGEFDDLVIWLSPNILYNRLIAAGAI